MVFFNGDWNREDVAKTLSAPDVAFATWKLDGGITVQLWPESATQTFPELSNIIGAKPSGKAISKPHTIPPLSVAHWRIIDALLDSPTAPMKELVKETGLTPKTIRKHLQHMIQQEVIFVMPLLGSLADAGELVYHLAVWGKVSLNELRGALGDTFMIGEADDPPMKYLLCRADDLADVTSRTENTRKLPGVESVRVTLNRELMPSNEFVHSLVKQRISSASNH